MCASKMDASPCKKRTSFSNTRCLLAERLREKGFEVVLTRETDTEVNPSNEDVNGDGTVAPEGGPARTEQIDDLQARVNICNLAAADLLVSVHYNGAENKFLSGYEVWFNDEREFSGRSEAFATFMHEALAEGICRMPDTRRSIAGSVSRTTW